MIKALIIDDEAAAVQVLRLMLERHVPAIIEIRDCTKPEEAPALIAAYQPDLVFQDIVMPGKNGFELLASLPAIHFDIIFTTAYNEYAIQAIRFSALDYLLKPINAEELKNAVDRFLAKRSQQLESEALLKNLLQNLEQKKQENFKLAIPGVSGSLFVSPASIIRLEGEGNYTRFYMADGQKLVSAKTLKEYEEILKTHRFLRIHKSHLVNRSFIRNYLKEGFVILTDQTNLPVSRQRKQELAGILLGNTGN